MQEAKTSLLPHLRDIRLSRDLTMRELESLSGVSKTTIYQIEQGTRNAQDATTRKLADALGVEVRELIFPAEQVEVANREDEKENEKLHAILSAMTDEEIEAELLDDPLHGRRLNRIFASRIAAREHEKVTVGV
jgi:transcriptional regulator with XRE-family HTH domain